MATAASVASKPLNSRNPASKPATSNGCSITSAHIEQHAERHEEHAHERVAQGQDVAHRAVAVLGVGHHHPAQERAERQREADQRGQPGGADAQGQEWPAGTRHGCGSRRPSPGFAAPRSAPRPRLRRPTTRPWRSPYRCRSRLPSDDRAYPAAARSAPSGPRTNPERSACRRCMRPCGASNSWRSVKRAQHDRRAREREHEAVEQATPTRLHRIRARPRT